MVILTLFVQKTFPKLLKMTKLDKNRAYGFKQLIAELTFFFIP